MSNTHKPKNENHSNLNKKIDNGLEEYPDDDLANALEFIQITQNLEKLSEELVEGNENYFTKDISKYTVNIGMLLTEVYLNLPKNGITDKKYISFLYKTNDTLIVLSNKFKNDLLNHKDNNDLLFDFYKKSIEEDNKSKKIVLDGLNMLIEFLEDSKEGVPNTIYNIDFAESNYKGEDPIFSKLKDELNNVLRIFELSQKIIKEIINK
ncbi:hypothetical protein [Methanobrevibacter curvatus]|uniref:Uncharacterized protein n=1 Tax=Methanobrevibacter curvatus TaxID=49547 RepID=A0A165Z7L2_9EURY|nr:hypothetical protein [Methanobrevibacter curvatus]KZX10353.1 hypothetical protein MBCUR_18290 [Methanobrevibacter curvatus]